MLSRKWFSGYKSNKREAPRGKPVASLAPLLGPKCSCQREASTGQARGIYQSFHTLSHSKFV